MPYRQQLHVQAYLNVGLESTAGGPCNIITVLRQALLNPSQAQLPPSLPKTQHKCDKIFKLFIQCKDCELQKEKCQQ